MLRRLVVGIRSVSVKIAVEKRTDTGVVALCLPYSIRALEVEVGGVGRPLGEVPNVVSDDPLT